MIATFQQMAAACAFVILCSGPAIAQHDHAHMDSTAAGAHRMPAATDWKMAAMEKHMAYSAARPLVAGDSVRAMEIVNQLRQAIAKYQDVKIAEADGYRMFAPEIKNQPQYHFTKNWNAMRNQFGFDPARPTSLLYRKDAQGRLVLTGAMYTASRRTSEDELDRRVPLSVARWHRHVNWCVPPRLDKGRWSETRAGRPVFGPLGVATKDECDAVGGRFIPQAFGWMVHADVFAGNDLRSIWHDDHMERDHAMLGAPKNPD